MFQCFCQHVNTDGICQLSCRFCETKHRTIPGHWVCYCQVNTYEQYFLNIPRQQAAFVDGKMYFCSYLNSYLGRVSTEETSTSMKTKF